MSFKRFLSELAQGWDKESVLKFLKTTDIDVNKKGAFDKIKLELSKNGIDDKYIDGLTASIIDIAKGTTDWRGPHKE